MSMINKHIEEYLWVRCDAFVIKHTIFAQIRVAKKEYREQEQAHQTRHNKRRLT